MGAPCAGPLSGMDECPIPPRESIQGLPGAVFVRVLSALVKFCLAILLLVCPMSAF